MCMAGRSYNLLTPEISSQGSITQRKTVTASMNQANLHAMRHQVSGSVK